MSQRRAGAQLNALVREQARLVRSAIPTPIESVAAHVTRIDGFTNAGQAASGHGIAIDEPVQFGGGGTAADPAELLLIALGASLSVTLTVHAALQEIELAGVAVAMRGSLDAGRFFSPSEAPGGGFCDLVLDVELTTRVSKHQAQALLNTALLASPVLRSIDPQPVVRLSTKEG